MVALCVDTREAVADTVRSTTGLSSDENIGKVVVNREFYKIDKQGDKNSVLYCVNEDYRGYKHWIP